MTGMSSERSCGDRLGRGEAGPPAITRSGSSVDDLLDVDRAERRDVGQGAASAGKSLESSVATTRPPAPRANRVSVTAGVSDTIFCGSAAI